MGVVGRKSSKADPKPVTLDAFGRDILRRREAADPLELPHNSGTRRTASKRALLKAVEDAGGER